MSSKKTPPNTPQEQMPETQVEDLMQMKELAPLPKGAEIAGKSAAKGSEAQTGSRQILEMLAAGKVTADEAERLMNAIPKAEPAPQPYLGGVEGPATRDEIRAAVMDVMGDKLNAGTNDKTEMLEMVGAMVEKIVRGLREPSEEEKETLRRKKETRDKLIKEQFEMMAMQKAIQDMCPHERATTDGKSHTTVTALHNYADGIVRGICLMCQKVIEPGDESYRQVQMSHALAMQVAQ